MTIQKIWNCSVVEEGLPPNFREEMNKLSDHPLLEVPIRTKGITSGRIGSCYWNSNLCAQTWGGEVVYGWNVSRPPNSELLVLFGHACWKTPEGNLVDPTNLSDFTDFRIGFLPKTDVQLVMNGRTIEKLDTFYFPTSEDQIPTALLLDTLYLHQIMEEEWAVFQHKEKDYSNVLGKIVTAKGVLKSVVELLATTAYTGNTLFGPRPNSIYSRKEIGRKVFETCAPVVQVITEDTPQIITCDPSLSLMNFISKALEENKSIRECFPNYELEAWWQPGDQTWTLKGIKEPSLTGISTATGKTISEIPPLRSLVQEHEIPKNKKGRRKVKRIAERHNLTPNEVVMLSNPYLFPHPYLVSKSGGTQIPRVCKQA